MIKGVKEGREEGTRHWPFSRRGELILGVVTALVSIVAIAAFAEDTWFHTDAWAFLTLRDAASPASLLEPHAGHLVVISAVLYRMLYGLFGMDFWPWYFLPRLIGYAGMVFVLWRMLRWRGADPLVAYAVFVILLFHHATAYMSVATFGGLVALCCFMGALWLIIERPLPTPRDRVFLGVLFSVAILSSTSILAMLVGTTVGLLFARRLRPWLPSLMAPGLLYVFWFLLFRSASGGATPTLSVNALLAVPRQSLEMLVAVLSHILPLPEAFIPACCVLLIVVLLWMIHTGRLGLYESMVLFSLGALMAMIILVRVSAGTSPATASRYVPIPTQLLVLALVPHIRLPRKSDLYYVVLFILVWIGVYQIVLLERGLHFWRQYSQQSRPLVEATAHLLAAGEPAVANGPIDAPRTGQLRVRGVQRLVAEGWNPPATSSDSSTFVEARGRLRIGVVRGGKIQGSKPITTMVNPRTGCTMIRQDQGWTAKVQGSGTLAVQAKKGTTAQLFWEDGFGLGVREIRFGHQRTPTQLFVELAAPDEEAKLRIRVDAGGPVRVCGLAPETPARPQG